MTDESPLPSPQQHVSTYIYLSSLYFVTVAALYLWGYWSPFNVNILEYLSLADIVKASAYPIASTFGFLALGAVLGEATGGRRDLPSGGGSKALPGRFFRKYRSLIGLSYIVGTLTFLFLGPSEKWQIALPVLLAIPITVFAKEWSFLRSLIPYEQPRSLCIFLFAILPFYAFGQGQMTAAAIIDGSRFEYVLPPTGSVSILVDADPTKNVRFLGHAGDFLFFWEPEKSILDISKFEDGKTLRLRRFERQNRAIH